MNPVAGNRTRPDAPARVPRVDLVLFALLTALLCVRPLLPETFDRGELSFLAGAAEAPGPTPSTTAWLDVGLLFLASIGVVRHLGRWLRSRAVVAALVALLAAVVISTTFAIDRRSAANAGASLWIAALVASVLPHIAAAQRLRSVLLAAMLASGAAVAVKCVTQHTYEFAETLDYWNRELKPQLVAQGGDGSDPTIVNYERRLRSSESFGYLAHPNVAASCLMMWLLPALSALACTVSRRAVAVAAATLLYGTLLVAALWFTGSAGALVALAIGVVLLLALRSGRELVAARPRATVLALGAAYAALIVAGVGYGAAKGTFPHPSLEFRWHYWTAAAHACHDAPLTGLGRQNFLHAYLRHKPVQSTEDVRDPHNLWVSLLVELGPPGLAAGVVLCAAAVLRAVRSLGAAAAVERPGSHPAAPLFAGVALCVLTLHAVASGTPLVNGSMALIWAIELALPWTLAFVAVAWVFRTLPVDDTALAAGVAAALVAALVHGLVDFALLTPAGIAVFAALTACAPGAARNAAGQPDRDAPFASRRPRLAQVGCSVGALALLTVYAFVVLGPTTRMTDLRAALRRSAPAAPPEAALSRVLLLAAAGRSFDPWDIELPVEVARSAARIAVNESIPPRERLDALDVLRASAPPERSAPPTAAMAGALAVLAECEYRLRAGAGQSEAALRVLRAAVAHFSTAVERNPCNPRLRIDAARAAVELWKRAGDAPAAASAAANLREALRIDAYRKPIEAIKLNQRERVEVDALLGELSAAGY